MRAVVGIVEGARPAVLPVEQPRKFIVREELGAGYVVIERVRNPRLLELLDSPAGGKSFPKEFEDMETLGYRAR